MYKYVCVLANLSAFALMGMEYKNQKDKENKLRMKGKSKFVGVRQRASGKWAAEIKDTSKKIRMWLGTYKTAEEAARAYDEAACLLRGSNTRTNFSNHHHAAIPTNSPISLKLRNLLDRKAIKNQNQSQNKSTIMSSTLQGEVNSSCSSEDKSLFWVQNQQVYDNLYGIEYMNMINCSMDVAPNSLEFDYSWSLPQQRINNLPTLKDSINVEMQLSASVYAMNEYYVEDSYDVNYPLSHLFCSI